MNNTKSILLVAIITSTLILCTSVIPMQTYAGENKNTKDYKSSIKASDVSDKKTQASTLARTTLQYRSDDPSQANQGQQVIREGQRGNRIQRPKQEPPVNTGHNRGSRRHWKQRKRHYANTTTNNRNP